MSTATATGTRRSRSTKGKGKGKGKNKAQSSAAASSSKSKATVNDKENEPPAEASLDGTQSLCENTLRMLPDETEKKKRPLVLRSPDSKEFQMGDKFSKYFYFRGIRRRVKHFCLLMSNCNGDARKNVLAVFRLVKHYKAINSSLRQA